MKVLHVDSSILGSGSASRRLTAAIVESLKAAHPGAEIVRRDLAERPLGHLTGEHVAAMRGPTPSPEPSTPEIGRDIAEGRAALEEFLAADVVVVGAPMYNFTIASQLKAWIDRLAVAGKTFAYTETGPKGLAGGKRIVVASSRGGFYGPGTPSSAFDHQETYLAGVFGFFGIDGVEFVRAEGLALGPEARDKGIAEGLAAVASLSR